MTHVFTYKEKCTPRILHLMIHCLGQKLTGCVLDGNLINELLCMCGIKVLLCEYRNTSSRQISQTAVFSVGNDLIILFVFHLGGPISFISLM